MSAGTTTAPGRVRREDWRRVQRPQSSRLQSQWQWRRHDHRGGTGRSALRNDDTGQDHAVQRCRSRAPSAITRVSVVLRPVSHLRRRTECCGSACSNTLPIPLLPPRIAVLPHVDGVVILIIRRRCCRRLGLPGCDTRGPLAHRRVSPVCRGLARILGSHPCTISARLAFGAITRRRATAVSSAWEAWLPVLVGSPPGRVMTTSLVRWRHRGTTITPVAVRQLGCGPVAGCPVWGYPVWSTLR